MSSKDKFYSLGFYLNYMTKENNNPFEILDNDEMRSSFSPFILNRFFSFSKDKKIQYVTQLLNRYTFSFYYQPEINFSLMYLLLPKSKFERLNYIRIAKEKSRKYDSEVYNVFKKVCRAEHLTIKEINEYIDYLLETNPQQLVKIFLKAGYSKKEIRKMLPDLKEYLKDVKEPKLTRKVIKDIVKKVQDSRYNITATKESQQNTNSMVEELL